MRLLHLAPLAGRGRRVAPGEGESPRAPIVDLCMRLLPLTRSLRCASASTSPRKRGEVNRTSGLRATIRWAGV